jgi:uncharacterized membrane protein
MLNCDRIDLMLARAQIMLAFTLLACVMALSVLLLLFHGTMEAVVVTLISTVVSQITGAMILACNYFLARARPHSGVDPSLADSTPQAPPPLVIPQEPHK